MVIIVGTGKLARELLSELPNLIAENVVAWPAAAADGMPAVVVHAGSGRELEQVITYCRQNGAPLIELSTGSAIAQREVDFPVVVCPNTNILMLKFMAMLADHGAHFRNYRISLLESHQAGKTSVPGTAVAMAESLGLNKENIRSIRNPQEQTDVLHIPAEHLARHAFHRIEIEDEVGQITLETRVFGSAPYASGLARIVTAVHKHPLEKRLYNVIELIEKGWI